MTSTPEGHILIIGAGATGLLIAQGLKKSNLAFSIYDSDPSLTGARGADWGIGVHWSWPQLEECLPPDMIARLGEAQAVPNYDSESKFSMPLYHGGTGEMLSNLDLSPKFWRFSRRRLRAFLAENIDINFGKRLIKIEAGEGSSLVTAFFDDGSKAEGNCLVGADGVHSAVRKHLFAEGQGDLVDVPYNVVRILASFEDPQSLAKYRKELHPINAAAIHPNGSFGFFCPIFNSMGGSQAESWYAQVLLSYAIDSPDAVGKDPIEVGKARLAEFASPWPEIIAEHRKKHLEWAGQLGIWKPKQWNGYAGRVTLAGDACHPMTPHRGQGLNHGITDAAGFVAAMVKVRDGLDSLSHAMTSFETEMITRSGAEVDSSLDNTRLVHDWNSVKQSPIFQRGIAKR